MGLKIENAIADDIPALVKLLTELFSIEQDFVPDTTKQARGLALLIQNKGNAVIKVARNTEGLAIGMVSAQLVISSAEGAASAWIEDMVIHQAFRGSGLGKALLQEVLNWAKMHGATRAQLLVDTENLPAIGFYQHLGWQTTQLQARRIFLASAYA